MTKSEIVWIKDALLDNKKDHEKIITEVRKINGNVRNQGNKLIKVEQKQKDHFFLHDKLDNMSRRDVTILIAVVNIIAIVATAVIVKIV